MLCCLCQVQEEEVTAKMVASEAVLSHMNLLCCVFVFIV